MSKTLVNVISASQNGAKVEWTVSARSSGVPLDGTTYVSISKSLEFFSEDLRSLYKELFMAGGASFAKRYEGYVDEDVNDHPNANAFAQNQRESRNSVNVERILEQRVFCFENIRYRSEDRQVIDALPQEWFRVQCRGNENSVWVRLKRMTVSSDVWRAFFAQELLRSMLSLYNLVGLDKIKEFVVNMLNSLVVETYRQNAVSERFIPFFAFVGNAGCGKTEVACLMARFYWLLGSLRFGHTCAWIGGELMASFEGQTVAKTLWAMRQARGGVFFLDEAYSLAQKESPYGMQALNTLCGLVDINISETGLIVAGYPLEMERDFFAKNQGLWSRLTVCEFDDYTVDELCRIMNRKSSQQLFSMDKKTQEIFANLLEKQKRFWPTNAGNGRAIDRIVRLMREYNNKRMMESIRKKVGRAEIEEGSHIFTIMDVKYALDEYSKTIKLRPEYLEQLRTFSRDFALCNTVDEMVDKELEMRTIIGKYLPKHSDVACFVCNAAFVHLGTNNDLYCTTCFFRVPAVCTECKRGKFNLLTKKCVDCGKEITIPDGMIGQISNQARLQVYGNILNNIRKSDYPTEDEIERFYVLSNRTAALIALRDGTLLPGGAERTEAIRWIIRTRDVLGLKENNNVVAVAHVDVDGDIDMRDVEPPEEGESDIMDMPLIQKGSIREVDVKEAVRQIVKVKVGARMVDGTIHEINVVKVEVAVENVLIWFLIVPDLRKNTNTLIGAYLEKAKGRSMLNERLLNNRLMLKAEALSKVRPGIGSLTLIKLEAVSKFFCLE
jgi:hypothetical protein